MSKEASSEEQKKTTPKKWNSPKDARSVKGAGKYPNFYTKKTRSGHVFTIDDSKDNEHITLQHRSGSMVQFKPDGAVQFVSHNGQYNVVFGENRMKITGAYDVTVEGAASMKVDGDYNMTVKGDANMTVQKDFNVTAKNFNQTVRGNIDVQAKNKTEKFEGSINTQAHEGITIQAGKALGLASVTDSVIIGAKKQIGFEGKGGDLRLKASGSVSVVASGGDVAIVASGKASMIGATAHVEASGDTTIKGQNNHIKATSDNKIHAGNNNHAKADNANKEDPAWSGGGEPATPGSAASASNPADITLAEAEVPALEE
jgi:uncharacterized protein (DUF2345 family)